MTPSTIRIPPPKRAGPHEFTSPVPKPPTIRGTGTVKPPPPRPPPPPPPNPPPPPPPPVSVPLAPQPVVYDSVHFKLRFWTVLVLTSSSWLKRLPLWSPEYVRQSSASGFTMSAGLRPPTSGEGLGAPICIVCPVQPR